MVLVWNMIKETPSKDIYELALTMDKVFGLDLHKCDEVVEEEKAEIPDEVIALVNERAEAKKNKNYALADEIRAKVDALGYAIKDTKEGAEIIKK